MQKARTWILDAAKIRKQQEGMIGSREAPPHGITFCSLKELNDAEHKPNGEPSAMMRIPVSPPAVLGRI